MSKSKTILLFYGLLLASNLLAQSFSVEQNRLFQQLEEWLEQYQLEVCESTIQTALSTAEKETLYHYELLHYQAKLEKQQGFYKQALKTIDYPIAYYTEKKHELTLARCLSFKASLLTAFGDFQEADELLHQAITTHQQFQGSTSLDYATSLFHYGKLRQEQEIYEAADSLFELAGEIAKDKSSYWYIQILYEAAISKLEQQELEATFIKLEEAKKIAEHTFESPHPLLALTNLYQARYYDEKDNFTQSLNLIQNTIYQMEQTVGKNHPYYTLAIHNKAEYDFQLGKYDEAEEGFLQSEKGFQEAYGENFYYTDALYRLGNCYNEMGQYKKSNDYWIRAKELYLKNKKMTDYAIVLNGIAINFEYLEDYQQAEAYYLEGIAIMKDNESSIFYVALMTNLADLYSNQKKFKQAEPLLLQSLNTVSSSYGTENYYYSSVIFSLANNYQNRAKFKEAKALYLEAATIDSTLLGSQHPDYVDDLYTLANVNKGLKNKEESFNYYLQANTGRLKLIQNYYSTFDESTRLAYIKDIQANFEQFFSFALIHKNLNNQILQHIQNLQLAIKSLALDFSIDKQISVTSIKDSSLLAINEAYLSIRKELATAYVLSEEERTQSEINIETLEEQVERLEKRLARSSDKLATQLADKTALNWENIKEELTTNEIAIDFLKFQYRTPLRKTDSVYYCALVTKKHAAAPELLYLAEEKQLARILKADVLQNGNNYIENSSIGYDLYQLIWQPLQPYLKDIKTIKISPTGLLHRVAFAALPTDVEGKNTLTKQFRFDYYGNMRDFIRSKKVVTSDKSIALMGGAYFNLDSMQLIEIAEQLEAEKPPELVLEDDLLAFATLSDGTRSVQIDSTRSAVEFNYLSGTETEVKSIQNLFAKKDWTVSTYLGEAALEDHIKQLEGEQAPSILHLATHGYFFNALNKESEDADENLRTRILSAENPLLRSGLVLSGANYQWKGGSRIPNLDDGILTAFEISNLNLFKTDLVVLSACETGLGDIYDTEGVFGLQRAFKAAGVDQLLISLWKVPDQQTLELMEYFYKFYLQIGDTTQALHKAQLKMSKKYRAYYWGAFVLMD